MSIDKVAEVMKRSRLVDYDFSERRIRRELLLTAAVFVLSLFWFWWLSIIVAFSGLNIAFVLLPKVKGLPPNRRNFYRTAALLLAFCSVATAIIIFAR